MTAPLLHRLVIPPPSLGGKPRIMGPLAADVIADAVRLATGRRPARGEIAAAWRALEAQGWRIVDVPAIDHTCAVAGCRSYAPFGFGPPGAEPLAWACYEHREEGRARVEGTVDPRRDFSEATIPRPEVKRPEPAQGRLFG